MKKHILLISTFILSFILLVGNVSAAKELTCEYKKIDEVKGGGNNQSVTPHKKAIIQTSDGKISYYTTSTVGESRVTEGIGGWSNAGTANKDDFKNTKAYDKEKNELTECPKCIIGETIGETGKSYDKFTFADLESDNSCPTGYVALVNEEQTEFSEKDVCKTISKTEAEKYKEETIYRAKCEYVDLEDKNNKIELYYNDNSLAILGSKKNYVSCINIDKLYSQRNGGCPRKIYYYNNRLYLDSNEGTAIKYLNRVSKSSKYYDENGNEIKSGELIDIKEDEELSDCSDLFGEELVKKINEVMNIIKIAVPILLIIFGISDFFKATFDKSEEDMKKSRDKFIKRIIAAIIVFLVPVFVNLVLKIANSVWDDINPDTCIK